MSISTSAPDRLKVRGGVTIEFLSMIRESLKRYHATTSGPRQEALNLGKFFQGGRIISGSRRQFVIVLPQLTALRVRHAV